MMFEKYTSIPLDIEAVRFTDINKDRIFNELTGRFSARFDDDKPVLEVETVHGDIAVVRIGDWIVKDKKLGTYYPIKDDIFNEKYSKEKAK